MAYPPKNLKLPAIVLYLHVGFTNISNTAFNNFLNGFITKGVFFKSDKFSTFLTSYLPLYGSLTIMKIAIPKNIPI